MAEGSGVSSAPMSSPSSAPASQQGSAYDLLLGVLNGESAAAAPAGGTRLPSATLLDAFLALHDELSSPHLRKEKNIQDFVTACACPRGRRVGKVESREREREVGMSGRVSRTDRTEKETGEREAGMCVCVCLAVSHKNRQNRESDRQGEGDKRRDNEKRKNRDGEDG